MAIKAGEPEQNDIKKSNMVRTCIAARLTRPRMMGQTNTSTLMAMGSVWILWLVDEQAAVSGSFLGLEGGLSEREEVEEGTGTVLGMEELAKSRWASL